jgi:hypothetical protein
MTDDRISREDASQIEGAGESFPCRGVSAGAAPLKVLFLTLPLPFKRPCEDIKGGTKIPLRNALRDKQSSQGRWGKRGQRPRPLRGCEDWGTKVRLRVGRLRRKG